LVYGVVLIHVNTLPLTAACTLALLEHFNWELFDHPPYSPDLAPSDYHLFTYLKNWLASLCFSSSELMKGVKTWLSSKAPDFFDTGIQKRIPRYDRCLSSEGVYVEK
jgi:transposase